MPDVTTWSSSVSPARSVAFLAHRVSYKCLAVAARDDPDRRDEEAPMPAQTSKTFQQVTDEMSIKSRSRGYRIRTIAYWNLHGSPGGRVGCRLAVELPADRVGDRPAEPPGIPTLSHLYLGRV